MTAQLANTLTQELSQADVVRNLSLTEAGSKELASWLDQIDDAAVEAMLFDWDFWARPKQSPPALFASGEMVYWLVKAGRGYGKTRIGAEQVRRWARDLPLVNLIGATSDDARDIMIEGESGILAVCPRGERPTYQPSKRRLVWPNGAISLIFTADEPERLRGKQHFKLWCDELAAWRYQESWEQAQLGLRLGDFPQAVITSTPKPIKLIKELMLDPKCVVTHGSTYDNKQNLAAPFVNKIITRYEGTRTGRQELYGEVLDDNPRALWKREVIELNRYTLERYNSIQIARVVTAVDPAVTAHEDSDDTGIVSCSKDFQDPPHYYVLADDTCQEKPNGWAKRVVRAMLVNGSDRVVGEVNNGGDLVESNIRHQNEDIPYKAVHASRGKVVRAEPISALYEQGRVHHVGYFGPLEDQMCEFDPSIEQDSPDRMDALVWALTELSGGDLQEVVMVQDTDIVRISPELDDFEAGFGIIG